MASLKEIAGFLDEYLRIKDIKDSSWNGLQVDGKDEETCEVRKIMLAVDASMDTFRKALEIGADMVIVHHGHFWSDDNPSVRGWNKERIDFLLRNGISLYAAHLPLDMHREVGNNAQLIKLLGAEIVSEFHKYDGVAIGWIGRLGTPKRIRDICGILKSSLKAECRTLAFGPDLIRTVAVCSGGGGYGGMGDFIESDADLYISGDAIDLCPKVKDSKRNVIFAGHHATEIVGVRALAGVLRDRFRVEAEFVDIPTGF